jgi:hypothetical protein
MRAGWIAPALCLCACARHVIALPAVPIENPPPGTPSIEVIARSMGAPTPLPLKGSDVAFVAVEQAIALAVAPALRPWAEAHPTARPGGWQLLVDLHRARAERQHGNLSVSLSVWATLRARDGNRYIAQTQAYCKQARFAEPRDAAPIFYACMGELGRELAGWLGGVQP